MIEHSQSQTVKVKECLALTSIFARVVAVGRLQPLVKLVAWTIQHYISQDDGVAALGKG